jgi:hypothetical protein
MTSPTITIYVGADLKFRWTRYCKAKGVKTSNALRDLMVFLLSKENGASKPSAGVSNNIDEGKSQRIVIRLKPSRLKELQHQARLHGFSPNRLISGLVDVNLAKIASPLLGQYEMDALTESTRQLQKLGTNVNQLARQLNISVENSDQLKLELIEEISKSINTHTQYVAGLIHANMNRWSIK